MLFNQLGPFKDVERWQFLPPIEAQAPVEAQASPCVMTVVTPQVFEEQFSVCHVVEQDDWTILEGDQIESLVTSGVSTCLMLAIRGKSQDGEVFLGMGHFSCISIDSFLGQEEENSIQEYLNRAESIFPSFDVFAAGMYDTQKFDGVCRLITNKYTINKLEIFSNPWQVELKDRLNDDVFLRYLEAKSYALQAGITPAGKLLIADQSSDSIEDQFCLFSEQDFEQWNNQRKQKAQLKARQISQFHHQAARPEGSNNPPASRLQSVKRKASHSKEEEKFDVVGKAILGSHKKVKLEIPSIKPNANDGEHVDKERS